MKKKLLIILGIIILLTSGLFVFLKSNSGTQSEVKSETATATPVLVTKLDPDVFIKHALASEQIKVETSATTSAGAVVTTGLQGRALLEADQSKTVLDFNTVTEIKDRSAKDAAVLSGGALWSRVQKLVNQGESFEIQTQNAAAVVRGTSFGLWYKDGLTRLWVTEGIVSFFAKDPVTGVIDLSSEVQVMPGQKASRQDNGQIVFGSLTAQDIKDPWFVYNNPAYELPKQTVATTSPRTHTQPSSPRPQPTTPAAPVPPATEQSYTVSITSVSPSKFEEGNRPRLNFSGTALTHVDSIFINNSNVTFRIENDTSGYLIPPALPAGTYSLLVIDDKNRTTRFNGAFTVTAKPAPEQPSPQDQPNSYPGITNYPNGQ